MIADSAVFGDLGAGVAVRSAWIKRNCESLQRGQSCDAAFEVGPHAVYGGFRYAVWLLECSSGVLYSSAIGQG